MKFKMLVGALAVISLSSTGCAVAPEPALAPVAIQKPAVTDIDPALWIVKDADTTIYLFGTVHILKPNLGWFDEAVKDAFDKSDSLVVEMVEPPADQSQALFLKLAMDQSGKTLRSKLTEAERVDYDAALASIGMPASSFDPLDPWAAAITIPLVRMIKQGYDPTSGVESVLESAAKASNKPVTGVETMEYQLGVFDGLAEANQLRFLTETTKSLSELDKSTEDMLLYWGSGDTAALAKLMNDGLSDPAIYDALLTKRNENWTNWLAARLDQPGTVFFAVGAGHLSGETSVPVLLAKRGIVTERVSY